MAIRRISLDVLPDALLAFRLDRAIVQDRKATRPNSNTRKVIRGSLGYECSLCGLESDWSENAPEYARLEIAHTIAACIGGTWNAWNLTGQCYTCNRDAEYAGMHDLRPFVIIALTIERFLPAKVVLKRDDVRNAKPLTGMASKAERRAARFARIGW